MTNPPKSITVLVTLAATLAVATGCSTPAATPTPAAATTAPAVQASPAERTWKPGVYKVGDDIQVGEYKTEGDGTSQCYWNRLSDDSGDSKAILARDIFSGPGRMTVKQGDVFVKFGGGCKWAKA